MLDPDHADDCTRGVGADGGGGTVTFFDGGTAIGTSAVVGSQATLTAALGVASHSIAAVYSGDGNFSGSNNSTNPVQVIVTPSGAMITLTTSGNPTISDRPVTFSATISSGGAPATPTGSVTFFDGATALGTAGLNGSTASLTVTLTGAGDHSLTATYGGDANFSGSSSPTLAESVATASQAFVSQVYLDLLHRPADSGGSAGWSSLLDSGVSRTQVVQAIENRFEYRSGQVQQLYQRLLHRAAEGGGLSSFTNFLLSGGTIAQVDTVIVGSTEYFQLHGSTNDGFLSAMYQDLLGREVDQVGHASFLLLLQQFTPRTALVSTVVRSAEFERDLVQSFYQLFLHRTADPAGLAGFAGTLGAGAPDERVIAGIVGSDEYFAKV